MTAGWPDPARFSVLLERLGGCIDFIEVGIPSERPLYDGPVIRSTHREVVSQGISASRSVSIVREAVRDAGKPLIVMAYLSDFKGDVRTLAEIASSMEASSLLVPDMLFEYYYFLDEYVDAVRSLGMRPSFFVSSKFPHGVLRRISSADALLIYIGLQPATGVSLPVGILDNVSLARKLVGENYLLAGFSIRDPETARALIAAGADAVVVGSELVRKVKSEGLQGAVEAMCTIGEAVRGSRP